MLGLYQFGFLYLYCFTIWLVWSLYNRLDVYIYDYLMKRKLHSTAKAFQAEGKVSSDPVGKNMWRFAKNRDLICILDFPILYVYIIIHNYCGFCVYMYSSYWRTWWFSFWMVVRLLGHFYCEDKWEALRTSCIIHRGGFTSS